MHRLLIAAASAAFIAAVAAPALAQEYPPCTHPGQDSCREMPMGWDNHHRHGHHHPAPPPPPPHHHHHH
jgi:hypothetical protein